MNDKYIVENVSSILSNRDFQFRTVFSGKTVCFGFQLISQGQLGIKREDLKTGYFNSWNVQSWLATVSLYMNMNCCCSVPKSCHNPMDCSAPGFPVLQYLLELAQTHVHWVSDATHPFRPLPNTNFQSHNNGFFWGGGDWCLFLYFKWLVLGISCAFL